MTSAVLLDARLPPDPTGDALADVYLFLLRKRSKRQQEKAVAARADTDAVTPENIPARAVTDAGTLAGATSSGANEGLPT